MRVKTSMVSISKEVIFKAIVQYNSTVWGSKYDSILKKVLQHPSYRIWNLTTFTYVIKTVIFASPFCTQNRISYLFLFCFFFRKTIRNPKTNSKARLMSYHPISLTVVKDSKSLFLCRLQFLEMS